MEKKPDKTRPERPARLRFETLAIHAGQTSDPQNGAVMTPVYFSSTFEQDAPAKPRGGYEYSRTSNPTRTALQDNLAALENGRWGLGFGSGLAATNALCHRLRPGDHVVATNDLYGGTFRLFKRCFEHFGIAFDFVQASDAAAVERALRPSTRYLFLESPTNPLLSISDLARLAALAKKRGVLTVVDNTFATPFRQRPLELGADLVLHSLTKYIGGHSDVVAGALIGNDEELRKELAFYQNAVGGQLGPMDAFLVLRGVKTLALRMERHCANAQRIAEALAQHRLVLYAEAMHSVPPLRWMETHRGAAARISRFDNLEAACQAVASDGGIAVLPCFIGDAVAQLQRVFPEQVGVNTGWIVYHETLRDTARIRAVVEALVEVFEEIEAVFSGGTPDAGQ